METDTPLDPAAEPMALARARIAVALAGAGAAAAQVVVVRELMVASAGNELSIAAVLSAWLLWSAAGSWIGGRVLSRSRRSPLLHVSLIAVLEVLVLALALGLARGGLHGLRELAGGALVTWRVVPPAGGTLSLPQLLLLTTVVTAPVGMLLGWQFAAGCALLGNGAGAMNGAPTQPGAMNRAPTGEGVGGGASQAYVADSLGHLAGGAALSFAAVTRVPAELVFAAACALVLGGVWVLRPTATRLVVGLVVVAALLIDAPSFRQRTLSLRWAPHGLVGSMDGPMGNVAVLGGEGGERSFFASGVHAFETGAALAGEQWVDIPLLAHASPKRVLLIGGGPRTLREVLGHSPEQVRYFELDPTIIRALREYAPPDLAGVLDDPRVQVSLGDARLHLPALTKAGEHFDVVLVAVGDPTTAQLNRYYTRKWFRQVRRVMAPDGLLAFQVMSSGDYLSRELRAYNACVYQTASRAGFRLSVFPGVHMTMIAALQPNAAAIFENPIALDQRIRSRGLDSATLLASFYDALDPFRREDRERELETTTDVRLNDDFAPTCYYYAQLLWASWWRGVAAPVLARVGALRTWHVLAFAGLATVLLAALSRWGKRPARLVAPYALLVAGAGGMTLEVVLLIGLQSVYGYVYGIIGYAVGMLMAGIALGGWLAQRRRSSRPHLALAATQAGLVLAAGLSIVGLVGLRFSTGMVVATGLLPVGVISLLMGLTGVAVGAAFPRALSLVRSSDVRSATALYATDLIGACGGALVAGLVLIPLLGMIATCAVVAAFAAGSGLVSALGRPG
jgi:spermidine synthase